MEFRSTRDFDIVLIVEALNESFAREFWDSIAEGGYELYEKSSGTPQFYRFSQPSNANYPKMIELFSRVPDGMKLHEDNRLTPIHISDEISSLSAILLDDDYYSFLRAGRDEVDDLPVLKAEYLVPFKMKAWLDLTDRKNKGQAIDSKDIKKHRNDVFRIVPLISIAERVAVPKSIKADIDAPLSKMPSETIDLKNLGIQRRTLESIIELYSNLYVCGDKKS
ncbi:MAG TPA: hypothetical protein VJ869_07020 [Sphaerochaeta sp.]|nr:hypothetical protein [Sphaerochaeta sp.]